MSSDVTDSLRRASEDNRGHITNPSFHDTLTPIEIQNLLRSIDEIKRPFASKEITSVGEQASDFLSVCNDKR